MRWLVILLMLGTPAIAQSPGHQTEIKQPPAANTNNKNSDLKADAPQQHFTINVVSPPKSEDERKEEVADRKKKAETDAKITEYTSQLADFTKGLFFATVALCFATIGLLVLGLFQSRDVKRSVEAAEKSAAAATKQADDSNRALTHIERPYIFVFDISRLKKEYVEGYDVDEDDDFQYFDLKVTYSVANYGKIPAVINCVYASISVNDQPLDGLAFDYDHPLATSPILAAEEIRSGIEQNVSWADTETDEQGYAVPKFGDQNVYFMITIEYSGPFTSGHETSDCWIYDKRTGRFRPHPDQKFRRNK